MKLAAFRIPAVRSICSIAQKWARQIGCLKGSIRDGEGNNTGCVYEVAHQLLFGGDRPTGKDIYDYDLFMPSSWFRRRPEFGVKLDCKSKERTVYELRADYDASVADHAGRGTNQNCHVYSFGSVSVTSDKKPLWIWFAGLLSKQEYLDGKDNNGELQTENELDSRGRKVVRWNNLKTGAEFRKKGLPYDDNGFNCQEDCWNRPYSYLERYRLSDIPPEGKENLSRILKEAREEGWGGSNRHIMLGHD